MAPPFDEGAFPLTPRAEGDTVVSRLQAGTFAPTLLAVVDHWERESQVLIQPVGLPLFVRTDMPLVLDESGWNLSIKATTAEYTLLGEMFADMRQMAPQALLRDLHRPVKGFEFWHEIAEGSDWHQLGAIIRELREAQVIPERAEVRSLLPILLEEIEKHRQWIEAPWKPARPDDAPRDKISFGGRDG